MSRFTVNDVLESIRDVSDDKVDISDLEDGGDDDYMSEIIN